MGSCSRFFIATASRRLIYGMNCGSVGFLMNDYGEEGLRERIAAAEQAIIHPLSMVATDAAGASHKALAINDVSLCARRDRRPRSAFSSTATKVGRAELRRDPSFDPGRLDRLQPFRARSDNPGSTDAQVMAPTPISAFGRGGGAGALLPPLATVTFEILEADKRQIRRRRQRRGAKRGQGGGRDRSISWRCCSIASRSSSSRGAAVANSSSFDALIHR